MDRDDDKTVISDRYSNNSPYSESLLTDFSEKTNNEPLNDRMIFAARLRPAENNIIGLNALIAASAPLLSEVVRLRNNAPAEDLGSLQVGYSDAIKKFERSALRAGVENSQVMAARYVLCTVVDEAIVCTSWGVESTWSQISLLSTFHNETFGGEKFFQLIDRVSRNPVKYLPLLELIYVCLSLGFEGKYRVMNRGALELEAIKDSLYRQIRQLRGDIPRELSPQWLGLQMPRRSLIRIVPWWMVVIFSVMCLAIMYTGFAWVLKDQREKALEPYQAIDSMLIKDKLTDKP